MDQQKLLDAILKHAYTEQQFRRLLAALQMFIESIVFSSTTENDVAGKLKEFFELHEYDEYTKEVLGKLDAAFFASFSKDSALDLFDELEKQFKTLPIISIYVPVELPPACIQRIGDWLREHANSRMVMRLSVEPDVAVGCAVVRDGVYHDFSFRYFLRKRKEELIATIHEYAHTS